MERKIGVGLLAALVLGGCSGSNEPAPGDGERVAAAESAAVRPAAAVQDAHAMHDTATGGPGAENRAPDMAGMDHGGMSMEAGAPSPAADAMHGMEHGRMASDPAPGAQGMDHSRAGHAMGSTPPGSAAAMDHSGATGTPHPAGHGRTTGTEPEGGRMDHPAMPDMRADDASGGGHAMDHGRAPAPAMPAGDGMEGLLTLVRELVKDPGVQRQIQEDPALRAAWADSAVRRIILR